MALSPSIPAVTFEEAPARTRTVTDADAAGCALLTQGDTATKQYRQAVRSLVALSDGQVDLEKVREDELKPARHDERKINVPFILA